ncbi:MAG: hypothetical protein IPM37_23365 [Hahellaceae bacterium]|nr:hypothetical protein [Hahellaceae bacterium]
MTTETARNSGQGLSVPEIQQSVYAIQVITNILAELEAAEDEHGYTKGGLLVAMQLINSRLIYAVEGLQ